MCMETVWRSILKFQSAELAVCGFFNKAFTGNRGAQSMYSTLGMNLSWNVHVSCIVLDFSPRTRDPILASSLPQYLLPKTYSSDHRLERIWTPFDHLWVFSGIFLSCFISWSSFSCEIHFNMIWLKLHTI